MIVFSSCEWKLFTEFMVNPNLYLNAMSSSKLDFLSTLLMCGYKPALYSSSFIFLFFFFSSRDN